MTDSSPNVQNDDETKPVLEHDEISQMSHHHHQDLQNAYQYPSGYYGQPYVVDYTNYDPSKNHPPLYFYSPNYQLPNYYYVNDDNINNNAPEPELSNNVASQPPPPRKIFTCPRILCCVVLNIIFAAIVCVVIVYVKYIVFLPRFFVVSFVVHSFEISSSSKLTMVCDIDMRVNNIANKDYWFEHLASSLLYKDTLLETTFSKPFKLLKKRRGKIHAEFDIPDIHHERMGGLAVNEMASDITDGYLSFDLKMDIKVELTIFGEAYVDNWDVFCDRLKLKFKNSTSVPKWSGFTHKCTVEGDGNWW